MLRIDETNFENFITVLSKNSLIVKKYGSFLTEQVDLINIIYQNFNRKEKILCLSAPPASGKTHVLLLLINYFLNKNNFKIAIILPFQELIDDFKKSVNDIDNLNPNLIDIISLSQFFHSNKNYDLIIIDEAHNLKSSLELNQDIVKSIRINANHVSYDLIKTQFFPPSVKYQSKRLNALLMKRILKNLMDFSDLKNQILSHYSKLSEFSGILFLNPNYIEIFLIKLNFGNIFKAKFQKLILSSATPLDKQELKFYCNFNKKDIIIHKIQEQKFEKNRRKILFIKQDLDFDNKCDFLISFFKKVKMRTIILTSNTSISKKIYEKLSDAYESIFFIPSKIKVDERKELYTKFERNQLSILVSSSIVFWEGINIKDLKLAIIFDIPHPRPSLINLYFGKKIDIREFTKKRLIQGIGRVARKSGQHGVVLLMFDPKLFLNESNVNSVNIWEVIELINQEFR